MTSHPTGAPEPASRQYTGVDLAAAPSHTGIATIAEDPHSGSLTLCQAQTGVPDEHIITAAQSSAKLGIDVPMGWPQRFVHLVSAHTQQSLLPPTDTGSDWRRTMAMRRTDHWVQQQYGLTPLSVATDRIAYPALRWAGIEARLRQGGTDIPRDGSGTVCEVYPAAALRVWELPHRQYKGPAGRSKRTQIVEGLDGLVTGFAWNGLRESCLESDDVLDALISALIAREADAARTLPPAAADQGAALSEGWIHVPQPLGAPGSPT